MKLTTGMYRCTIVWIGAQEDTASASHLDGLNCVSQYIVHFYKRYLDHVVMWRACQDRKSTSS
jgi:TnpA family transposase